MESTSAAAAAGRLLVATCQPGWQGSHRGAGSIHLPGRLFHIDAQRLDGSCRDAANACGAAVPRRFRLGLLVAVLLLGASVVVSRWDHLVAFKRDKHVSASEMAESANLRPILAAYAWEMFRDRPFAGCGFGQYRQVNVDYQSRRSFDVPMEKAKQYVQHNVFLSLLTETGLMGVTLFVLLLWLLARRRLEAMESASGRRCGNASRDCCPCWC